MATVAESLFGVTPESLQATREQQLQEQALQFAQLSPMQAAQAGFYTAGSRLGTGIGGLLGAEDPELMRVRQRQQLLQGVNPTDPASLRAAAQQAMEANDFQAAQELASRAMAAEQSLAKISADTALASQRKAQETKLTTEANREEQLRTALAALPAEATDKDVEAVVRQFGNPDKIFATIEKRQTAELNRQAKAELEKEKAEERARIERDRLEFRQSMAALAAQQRAASSDLQRQMLQLRIDDLKAKQTAKEEATTLKQDAALNHAGKVITDVQEASGLVRGMTTGLMGKAQSLIPGTDAFNLNQRLLTIKANLGFDRLQQMRDASPTGGALGQVAVQELNALQSTVGSLEIGQDRQELSKNLEKIEHHYNNWIRTTRGEKPISIEEYRKTKPSAEAAPAAGNWSIRIKQ